MLCQVCWTLVRCMCRHGSNADVLHCVRRCVVGLVGLGFAPGPEPDSIQNDSLLMAQELCRGGSLRDLVAEQMVSPREVCGKVRHTQKWANCKILESS